MPKTRPDSHPVGARAPRKRGAAPPNSVKLHRTIDTERHLVDCTQRAVARGRRTVVDAECRVLRFSTAAAAGVPEERRLREIAARLERSHGRLLQLSAQVERECDALDVASAELERLTKV